MKNSKLRRALLLFACAVLLVCLSVGATLAYLTSTTDMVENTFTVGKVSFDKTMNGGLDEAEVDEYGENPEDKRVLANEYKIVPNHLYIKDPTVHIAVDSESCFVFVKLNKTSLTYVNEDGETVDIEDKVYTSIKAQIEQNWTLVATESDGVVYVYNKIVNTLGDDETEDIIVFNNFKVAANADVPTAETQEELDAMLADLKITVKGYAVQADTFTDDTTDGAAVVVDDAVDAWDVTFSEKLNTNS